MEIEKTISRFQDTISVIGLQSPIALMSLLKSLPDYMVLINNCSSSSICIYGDRRYSSIPLWSESSRFDKNWNESGHILLNAYVLHRGLTKSKRQRNKKAKPIKDKQQQPKDSPNKKSKINYSIFPRKK